MPNATCNNCKKDLNVICRTNSQKFRLIELLNKRVKKVCGVPYNVSPGIQHNEIVNNHSCKGVLYYNHFSPNPTEFKDIDLSKVIFSEYDIDTIKNKLIHKSKKKNIVISHHNEIPYYPKNIINYIYLFYFLIFIYQIYIYFPNTIS